ncbi:MAG: DUF5666 domain-containing protein [Patescibacteria group bacterium]|jgi:hypothetical protein
MGKEEKSSEIVEKTRYHYPHALKMALILIVLVVIGGVGFGLGRMGSWHRQSKMAKFGTSRMMMGNGMRDGFAARGHMYRQDESQLVLSGDIAKINGNTFSVTAFDGTAYLVNVSSSTSYSKNGAVAKQSDVIVGNFVQVFGTSDSSGNITATSITIR